MAIDTPELDSAAKIRALRADFDDDGQMSSSNIQFMFDYISALEVALEYSAGAGLTQAESDALEDDDSRYVLAGYVEDAVIEKDSHTGRHRAEGV
jgi:hypothetical protein